VRDLGAVYLDNDIADNTVQYILYKERSSYSVIEAGKRYSDNIYEKLEDLDEFLDFLVA
jgi:hypothetical protein